MSLDIWFKSPPCPHCGRSEEKVYDANITHNLTELWEYLGCYDALYESSGREVTEILPELLGAMSRFEEQSNEELARFNAPNGWGTVSAAREWLYRLVEHAQSAPPGTVVGVWR